MQGEWNRRAVLRALLGGSGTLLAACGGGSDAGGSGDAGSASAPGWRLVQRAAQAWAWRESAWPQGDQLTLDGVRAGSTLVMCAWGYVGSDGAGFRLPVDSQGQAVQVAADTQMDARLPVQSMAWVLHDAAAGTHVWTGLPDLGPAGAGDGVAVLIEFTRDGAHSSAVVGVGTATVDDLSAPWFTGASVAMSSAAQAGDLLVACGCQEEATTGAIGRFANVSGWSSAHAQTDSRAVVAGEVCWRPATGAELATVGWAWSADAPQDPTLFKGLVFALR